MNLKWSTEMWQCVSPQHRGVWTDSTHMWIVGDILFAGWTLHLQNGGTAQLGRLSKSVRAVWTARLKMGDGMRTRRNCFPSILPTCLMCQQNGTYPSWYPVEQYQVINTVKYFANRNDQLHRFCIKCFPVEQKADPTFNTFGGKSEKQSKI